MVVLLKPSQIHHIPVASGYALGTQLGLVASIHQIPLNL
jgi:hypothetical protein